NTLGTQANTNATLQNSRTKQEPNVQIAIIQIDNAAPLIVTGLRKWDAFCEVAGLLHVQRVLAPGLFILVEGLAATQLLSEFNNSSGAMLEPDFPSTSPEDIMISVPPADPGVFNILYSANLIATA
ncbi:unnamed protein product, partial [marine sediment metagenome]